MFEGNFVGHEKYSRLNEVLQRLSEELGVSKEAVAISWILRHPANFQVLIGTMNEEHLKEICMANKIYLTRQEWYELYCGAGYTLP